MKKRLITKISKIKFKPFDNYGKVFKGMKWYKITYDKKRAATLTSETALEFYIYC